MRRVPYFRGIPGRSMSFKAPFPDGEQGTRTKDTPEVEHMWLSEVDFDGQFVRGVLLNAPNWLKTVKVGLWVAKA